MIGLLKRVFAADQSVEEWPLTLSGHELARKVDILNLAGHSRSRLNNWTNIQIVHVKLFTKQTIPIPNSVLCARVNWMTVKRLTCLKADSAPPIVVMTRRDYFSSPDRKKLQMYVADGVQRLIAARERGESSIVAYIPADIDVDLNSFEEIS